MTDEQIDKMVAELVEELDYDYYKELYGYPEQLHDDSEYWKESARKIVRKYI